MYRYVTVPSSAQLQGTVSSVVWDHADFDFQIQLCPDANLHHREQYGLGRQ